MPVKVKGDSNLGRREAPSALIATMVKQVFLLRVSVPKHWSGKDSEPTRGGDTVHRCAGRVGATV